MQLFQRLGKKNSSKAAALAHTPLAISRWSWLLLSDLQVSKPFPQTRVCTCKTPSTSPNPTVLPPLTRGARQWESHGSTGIGTPLTCAEQTLATHGCFQPAVKIRLSVAGEHQKNLNVGLGPSGQSPSTFFLVFILFFFFCMPFQVNPPSGTEWQHLFLLALGMPRIPDSPQQKFHRGMRRKGKFAVPAVTQSIQTTPNPNPPPRGGRGAPRTGTGTGINAGQ